MPEPYALLWLLPLFACGIFFKAGPPRAARRLLGGWPVKGLPANPQGLLATIDALLGHVLLSPAAPWVC